MCTFVCRRLSTAHWCVDFSRDSALRMQPAEFVASLQRPRAIIILVQAGRPVDDTIATLSAFCEPGELP